MKQNLLILGNGFDLDLGLHTGYSEFWESDIWKSAKDSCPEKYLVTFLDRYRISHNWFDLESGLLEGATRLKGRISDNYNNGGFRESFQILTEKLREYIKKEQESFIPNKDSAAVQLLHSFEKCGSLPVIYSFNYTDLDIIGKRFDLEFIPTVHHVHGSLQPYDQIILGIELDDILQLPSQLTFLIKSNNPFYQYTNLLKDLDNASDVIFFGHSINGMDFPYFKDFFQNLVTAPIEKTNTRRITIITYDEKSAMQIKDNFRRNGIDVRTLFNKVALEFIMTKGIYEGNQREGEKFAKLKSEIER